MAPLRELWFLAPREVALRPASARIALDDGQVRARAIVSGISQGTELLLYRGEGPIPFDPGLDAPNAPTYPRRYGYAWVGRVVETGAVNLPIGSRLFALLPHGDEHVIDAESARLLIGSIPPARATLAANLETAVTVTWDAGVSLGDDVVVLGGGVVGLLSAWLARRAGAGRVRLVEPSAPRRAAAESLGIDGVVSPELDEPRADADVVIEATGNPSCLDRAIAHAARDATIVVASFYGEQRSEVALGSAFHRRRISLKASQVSHLPAHKSARWTFDRRFALVSTLLEDARLDMLVDPPVPFDQAPATYARLMAEPGAALHTVFAYDTPEKPA